MYLDFGINMEKKLRGRIHNILRNDFKKSKLYSQAIENAKLDSKVYQCQECKKIMYTGVSEKNFKAFQEKYEGIVAAEVTVSKKGVKRAKTMYDVDHVEPVVPYGVLYYEINMEDWIDRLHCDISNLRLLCKDCHKEKTKKEAELRAKCKKLKKLEK